MQIFNGSVCSGNPLFLTSYANYSLLIIKVTYWQSNIQIHPDRKTTTTTKPVKSRWYCSVFTLLFISFIHMLGGVHVVLNTLLKPLGIFRHPELSTSVSLDTNTFAFGLILFACLQISAKLQHAQTHVRLYEAHLIMLLYSGLYDEVGFNALHYISSLQLSATLQALTMAFIELLGKTQLSNYMFNTTYKKKKNYQIMDQTVSKNFPDIRTSASYELFLIRCTFLSLAVFTFSSSIEAYILSAFYTTELFISGLIVYHRS